MPETKYKRPKCPLKWHGGKSYDAKWIVDHMPPHLVYIEPFFGSGKVLFARDPNRDWFDGHPKAEYQSNGQLFGKNQGCSEIANDIHGELMNFWETLRDMQRFEQLQLRLSLTPFSQLEFEAAEFPTDEPIERAARFFVRNRQSRQGLNRDFATMVRNRTRGGKSDPVNAYLGAIDGLLDIHHRLQRVVILNMSAIQLIQREDNDVTFFYLDPPYPAESRTAKDTYEFEMTDDEHHELLDVACNCQGKFMISTYPNNIYNQRLKDWNFEDRERDNKASSFRDKSDKKIERIWMNY